MYKMNRMAERSRDFDLAGRVIGFAMKVHTQLGAGFLESVYTNALALELRKAGIPIEREKSIAVTYEGETVGLFVSDVIVDGSLIIETKAVQALVKAHEVQLVNYLTATGINEGLLLNFGGQRLEYKKKFRLPKSEPVSF